MKKITLTTFLFSFLLMIIIKPSIAQKKEITKDQIPPQIITAIQSDFPAWNIDNTKWYLDSEEVKEWAPLDENIDRYVVEVAGKNHKTRAIYDNKGKLRYSKTTTKNIALPKAIRDRLASDEEFEGWQLTSNQEIIRNFKEDKKVFVVHLQKDGKKKTVRFDRMGEKVKAFRIG